MEIALETDGPVALVRVTGDAAHADRASLGQYLQVARENRAVRAIVDLSQCPSVATTVVSLLLSEAAAFAAAGGALTLTGLDEQNPFLRKAVEDGTLRHHRTLAEGAAAERKLASGR